MSKIIEVYKESDGRVQNVKIQLGDSIDWW